MKFRVLFAAAAGWFSCLASAAFGAGMPAPALPSVPPAIFNLKSFGAVADGRTPATDAIRRAIAAVDKAGGGTLIVPAGNYFTGPFDLCSRLNLHLEAGARLLFSQNRDDYPPPGKKPRSLIEATDCHDLIISGAGVIDGQGAPWWVKERKAKLAARARARRRDVEVEVGRPRMLVLTHCQRVLVTGVTLTNSPRFHLMPIDCDDVTVNGIRIFAPADSPNTDGIDPSVSRRVLIMNCTIDTGDDCIAIKAGRSQSGGTRDVLVTDCAFLHGHGCSIGSQTDSGVENMVVRNCTFDGTDIGVRLKSERGRGGLVENVTYTDLTMRNVGQAIVISSYYRGLPKLGQTDAAAPVTARTPVWKNIVVRNLIATDGTRSAGLIMGLPEMPASAITLDTVSIDAPAGLRIGCARDITLRRVAIDADHGPPVITEPSAKNIVRTE